MLNALVDLQNIQAVVSKKKGEEKEVERIPQEQILPQKMVHREHRFNLHDQKELKMQLGGQIPIKMYQKYQQPASYRGQAFKNPHHGIHDGKFVVTKQPGRQPHPPKGGLKENILFRTNTPPPNPK